MYLLYTVTHDCCLPLTACRPHCCDGVRWGGNHVNHYDGFNDRGEIVIYQPAEGGPTLEVRLEKDTIWLDAHQMAALFERDRTVIVRHIGNVYATGELSQSQPVQIMHRLPLMASFGRWIATTWT